MTSRWVQEGSRWVRRGSEGDSEDDGPTRESLPTSDGSEGDKAATPPNAAPQVSEAPRSHSESTEASESHSEVSSDSSSESEFEEGPEDQNRKKELYKAIGEDADLEKVKSLIQQHPSLLR